MTAQMVTPAWMRTWINAEQYDSWSEEQCAGTEVVDGMVVVSPSASTQGIGHARAYSCGLILVR